MTQLLAAAPPRFVQLERVAAGGMGTVFRALDAHTHEPTALKVLSGERERALERRGRSARATERSSETSSLPGIAWHDRVMRFRRESRLLAHLDHPSIVPFRGQGTLASGEPYFAMPWLEGETLGARLLRGPLSVAETIDVATRVATALGHVHEHGIVHRDVKPSNILLLERRIHQPVLLDFGVARRWSEDGDPAYGEALVGTVGYLSPEQARGDRDVDPRTDVFALGCVMYKCLAGRLPFEGDDPVAIHGEILLKGAPPIRASAPWVPANLAHLIDRMLSCDREERPRHGDEIARALQVLEPAPTELRSGERRAVDPRAHEARRAGRKTVVSLLAIGAAYAPHAASGTFAVASPESNEADDTPPTWVDETDLRRLRRIRSAARSIGANVSSQVGGALLVTLASGGSTAVEVAVLADLALRLQPELEGSSMGIATGEAVVVDGMALGDVVARARGLAEEQEARILLDAESAAMLRSSFLVERWGSGWTLRAREPRPGLARLSRDRNAN